MKARNGHILWRGWRSIFKIYSRETVCENYDWINLAQGRVSFPAHA
jgi:hypothetical protein